MSGCPDPAPALLIDSNRIRQRVEELGRQLAADYAGCVPHLVVVLRGAAIFAADLQRALALPSTVDYISIASYEGGVRSSGVVRLVKDLEDPIEGRDVLVVEDIVDSGRTLAYLLELLKARGPASLQVCTLLDKPEAREVELECAYTGFLIPDEFVVGYGMDWNQRYRGLPNICSLKGEATRLVGKQKADLP